MLLSAMSVLVVAQSSSEIPEGLMNNPVFKEIKLVKQFFTGELYKKIFKIIRHIRIKSGTSAQYKHRRLGGRAISRGDTHCWSPRSPEPSPLIPYLR